MTARAASLCQQQVTAHFGNPPCGREQRLCYRWVQRYAPELEKRSRPYLKATTDSWRVDETYVKVKKTWMDLYRAVDSAGNTLKFLFSPTRDAQAAKRFFSKTLAAPHTTTPRVITVDKNAAYPKALKELKAEGAIREGCQLRQSKYLNNLVEQDHRFIKRLVKPGMGFFSWETAWRTLQGYEIMHMMRKGQVRGVNKGDIHRSFLSRSVSTSRFVLLSLE